MDIITLAQPNPSDLLEAREVLQRVPAEVFERAIKESWGAEKFQEEVKSHLTQEVSAEALSYLVDEYTQLGPGIFLVSNETGRVIGSLSEEDLYTPAPVPREGSSELVTQTPKIRPDIEASIVVQGFEAEREVKILNALAERGHQTALLREMGDPRLLIATRNGRKKIVGNIQALDPKALLKACGGTSAAFLSCFTLVTEAPKVEGLEHTRGVVQTKSIMNVADPITTNLSHNREATLRGAIVQGWVREIASGLRGVGPKVIGLERMGELPGVCWVVQPHLVRPIKTVNPNLAVLPAYCPMYCIHERAGFILVPKAFEAFSAERFDRWETSSLLEYEIWYDRKAIQGYTLEGVDDDPQSILVDR